MEFMDSTPPVEAQPRAYATMGLLNMAGGREGWITETVKYGRSLQGMGSNRGNPGEGVERGMIQAAT